MDDLLEPWKGWLGTSELEFLWLLELLTMSDLHLTFGPLCSPSSPMSCWLCWSHFPSLGLETDKLSAPQDPGARDLILKINEGVGSSVEITRFLQSETDVPLMRLSQSGEDVASFPGIL